MRIAIKTVIGSIVAASLFVSSGAQAWTRRDNLFAGALAGATVGALAGSAFAAPPLYSYRAPPAWHAYPPPRARIEVYHSDVWGDDPDDDWDD
ncbi:hypothetical protein [Bosea psychrotolerans]|uniref:PXPV repeat-containing protein n=1 Tax=Bosea psychrotolerans TaxID=1871628 RepID=A0A2S4LVQ4_9HYPH|nr:hypothetical protein [Bosea psychrotolerans]POR46526.1 hypothetical protein CYD53_12454 [Bosea psychrotolerans]